MFRSRELEPIVHHRVIREGGESVVRSLDIVEEDSAILVLHDRLELLLGGFLLDGFDGEILFARNVILVLPLMNPIDIVVSASAPAPAPQIFPGRMFGSVPSAAPTSALGPAADSGMLRTAEAMKLIQSVGRDASMEHNAIPDVLRPLRRLRVRGIDEGRSTGPLVCELPGAGHRRVTARWWTVERCHR